MKNKCIIYCVGFFLNSALISLVPLQATESKMLDSFDDITKFRQRPFSELFDTQNHHCLQSDIEKMFYDIPNHSFKYYKNDQLIKVLSSYISKQIPDIEIYSLSLKIIQSILEKNDFRLISDFLQSLISHDNDKFNHFLDAQHFMTEINKKRFENTYGKNISQKNVLFVQDLESVFDNISSDNNVTIFIKDQTLQEEFLKLLNESQNNLSSYIDSHYDLSGINSLVRKGLVKTIILPNGRELVTKKDNPQKKGRFLSEQRNVAQLQNILYSSGDQLIELSQSLPKQAYLRLIVPSVIFTDGNQGNLYSLTNFQKGKTLEEVLLTEFEVSIRSYHLNNIRNILDTLYDHGIVWGDMAPRNIIVDEFDNQTNYHILDFEKTTFMNSPVPLSKRIEHCWGPMCVDEFGAVLSREEIEITFRDYFDPASWKTEILENIPSITSVKLEDVKNIRQKIAPVRFPFFGDFTKNIINICFKIDHYFGTEYDIKTIEIFKNARNKDYFTDLMTLLENLLEDLDNKLIFLDFINGIKGLLPSNITEDMYEVKLIKQTIDKIYNSRKPLEDCKELLTKYKSQISKNL